MCDTVVAVGAATLGKSTLFGKNSDRLRDEPQVVSFQQRRVYEQPGGLACTYIRIPQARRTHAVLLSRPYWTWGAEMGANEHGVAIGNEALFARMPSPEEPALLGMDLVRLGLERGASAEEALSAMVELLEQFGQGGNCAIPGPTFYHNSFLIADAREAFVLETMGRHWLVEKVRDVRSISNTYSIVRPDKTSTGLMDYILRAGWADKEPADFAAVLADTTRRAHSGAQVRCRRATELLHGFDARVEVASMFAVLRDHGEESAGRLDWRPGPRREPMLCSHASDLEPRGQTTGSLVSDLRPHSQVHWVTAGPTACLSIFKPLFIDTEPPALGPELQGERDPCAYWRQHDALVRALLEDERQDLVGLRKERDALEANFLTWIEGVRGESEAERQWVVDTCWRAAAVAEERWARSLQSLAGTKVVAGGKV
jgi:secernin